MFAKPAIAFACFAALSAGAVRAADAPAAPAATTSAITAQYAVGCTGALDPTDKNLTAWFAMFAPEFVDVDPKGKETKRDEMVAQMKQQLKTFHGTDCKNDLGTVTAPDANSAVAMNTLHITGDIQAPDGKHDLDLTDKTQDTWKLVSGTWLVTQTKHIHTVVKIDGAVVQDLGQ